MFKRKLPSLGINPAQQPRNAFDLSERSLYTQAPGMLLPVFVKEMNPDEHIDVNIASEIQAQTLKGRAFFGMEQHFAAYFVPYNLLWSYWPAFIAGLTENNTLTSSSFHTGVDSSELYAPSFHPYKVLSNFRSVSFSSNRHSKDALGYDSVLGYSRLFDMLGYGNLVDGIDEESANDYSLNSFRFLAYQKIYQDHFLDDRYETRDPYIYNADIEYSDGSSSYFIDEHMDSFKIRYAKYNKDFLNNFQSTPLFVTNVYNVVKPYVGTGSKVTSSDTIVQKLSSDSSDKFVPSESFSAATIRNLFALDRMAQISSRAGKTYREQMLAHYGVKVDNLSRSSAYCGGYTKSLDNTPVIATASSKDGTQFGEQGSFIDNVSGGHISYNSNEFGVFMILSWVSPRLAWDTYGIDPFNIKICREDYFVPEQQDLGLQPLYSYYLNSVSLEAVPTSEANIHSPFKTINNAKAASPSVYGWTPRYSEYKSSYDKLHGEFRIPIHSDPKSPIKSYTHGTLSFLTSHSSLHKHARKGRPEEENFYSYDAITLQDMFVDPGCLNECVEVAYNGTEATDPFRVETQFTCSCIRNMSVSGLPRL